MAYTLPLKCTHCGNTAPLDIKASFSRSEPDFDPVSHVVFEETDIYEMAICPACNNILLVAHLWTVGMEPEDVTYRTLYPPKANSLEGLPASIQRAYDAAQKVKPIDANAYGVLVRRLLELICSDRNASGRDLFRKLDDLAQKGEIPSNLLGVAHGVRALGNIGAHADLGELSSAEVALLESLSKAILEYVYIAPQLAQQAQNRLNGINQARNQTANP